jgi:hypothetical protein
LPWATTAAANELAAIQFNTRVVAGLSLSVLGIASGVREFRRGDRRNALVLAAVSNSATLLLAVGYYAMVFLFEHF